MENNKSNSFSEAYLKALQDIYENGSDLDGLTIEKYTNDKKNGMIDHHNKVYNDDNDDIFNNENYYYNRGPSREKTNYSFTIKEPKLEDKLIFCCCLN